MSQSMLVIESLNLSRREGTPLALEQACLDDGECWCLTEAAGLHYYSCGKHDERLVAPLRVGDIVSPVRRPDHPVDSRAIEVWWCDQFHLGYLPHLVSQKVAIEIDGGKARLAYVWSTGGTARTLQLVLIGVKRHATRTLYRRLIGALTQFRCCSVPSCRGVHDRGISWRHGLIFHR